METVVDVTIPTDQFVLADTLDRVPGVELEVVRSAIAGSDGPMPLVRGSAGHLDRLGTVLGDDPTVAAATRLSGGDRRGLFAIEWSEQGVIDDFASAPGTVLEARGSADAWRLRVLFPDRATASETYQTWCSDGIDLSLCRIQARSDGAADRTGLSAAQHDAIVEAFRTDYYDVPRGTTLAELATNFGVSHQALSECLRRGHANLVEMMLSDSPTVSAQPL